MGYVGTAPLSGDYRKLDDISSGFNGVETAFALQVGSVNVTPPKATAVLISVGGILQEPVSAYDISVSTITFTAPPAAGVDFFGVMLGAGVDVGTPGDDTVATVKILDNAVTLAKLASGTDGNLISYDASGDPVAVATGTAGQILTSAGAGAPPTFAAAAGGGITDWDQWRLTTTYTNSGTQILSTNLERSDNDGFAVLGSGMSHTSGNFVFPIAGYWAVQFNWLGNTYGVGDSNFVGQIVYTADNWSSNHEATQFGESLVDGKTGGATGLTYFYITDVANQGVRFTTNVGSSTGSTVGHTDQNRTYMNFTRLG